MRVRRAPASPRSAQSCRAAPASDAEAARHVASKPSSRFGSSQGFRVVLVQREPLPGTEHDRLAALGREQCGVPRHDVRCSSLGIGAVARYHRRSERAGVAHRNAQRLPRAHAPALVRQARRPGDSHRALMQGEREGLLGRAPPDIELGAGYEHGERTRTDLLQCPPSR